MQRNQSIFSADSASEDSVAMEVFCEAEIHDKKTSRAALHTRSGCPDRKKTLLAVANHFT
jgi:hypothetical protein